MRSPPFRGPITPSDINPWWGCTKIQAPNGERSACDFCYAAAFAHRLGHEIWGKDSERRLFGDKHWAEPLRWDRKAEHEGVRRRVFCASMADVFEDRRDLDEPRRRLFELIEATPHLDWQLLTKRPEQMTRLAPTHWGNSRGWPPNAWAGTTVEDQRAADLRVPRLLAVPATIRFLSCEPIFTPIDLTHWLTRCRHDRTNDGAPRTHNRREQGGTQPRISWVIAGGESGPHHQPLDLDHARNLRDQCRNAGVPYFFKQVGGRTPTAGGDLLDDRTWKQFPDTTGA